MRSLATPRTMAILPILVLATVVGACVARAQVNPAWDHYRFYEAFPTRGSSLIGPPVGLTDQFGAWQYGYSLFAAFLAPSEKVHGASSFPINDPDLHYTFWVLGIETFAMLGVQFSNQFGPQTVDLSGNSVHLVNPALKNGAPGALIPVANHYKCYNCTGDPVNVTVTLKDQFFERTVLVMSPQIFCNPAIKTDSDGTSYQIIDPAQYYVAYSVDPMFVEGLTVLVTDQYLSDVELALYDDPLLWVPSTMGAPTGGRSSTWGRLKTLYR